MKKRIISIILTTALLCSFSLSAMADELPNKCGVRLIEEQHVVPEAIVIEEFPAYQKGQFAYTDNGECILFSNDAMELLSLSAYGNKNTIWKEYTNNIVDVDFDKYGMVIYSEEMLKETRVTKTYKKSVSRNVAPYGYASTIKFTATFFYDYVQNYYEVIDTSVANLHHPNWPSRPLVTLDTVDTYYTDASYDPHEVIAYCDFTVVENVLNYSLEIDAVTAVV